MKFKKLFSNEKGVTPVVGVMLMVVVTVILAAAVSSYAGSMKSQDVAPQVAMKGSASVADEYVKLDNLGGSAPLRVADMMIEISGGYPTSSGYVEMKNVTFTDTSYEKFFRPGDVAMIPFTAYSDGSGGNFADGEINLGIALGNPFKVTVIDKATGQTVCTTTLTMNP